MSEDIVKRLRSQEIVFPAGTQIVIAAGTIETMQPISMWTGGDRLEAAAEIERLRARVEVLEQLARESLHVLTCSEEDDDPGHRCSHCDDYVDRNGPHRNALRAALEAKP
jgi:hypothetical protein